jgi:hypothetical protein
MDDLVNHHKQGEIMATSTHKKFLVLSLMGVRAMGLQ